MLQIAVHLCVRFQLCINWLTRWLDVTTGTVAVSNERTGRFGPQLERIHNLYGSCFWVTSASGISSPSPISQCNAAAGDLQLLHRRGWQHPLLPTTASPPPLLPPRAASPSLHLRFALRALSSSNPHNEDAFTEGPVAHRLRIRSSVYYRHVSNLDVSAQMGPSRTPYHSTNARSTSHASYRIPSASRSLRSRVRLLANGLQPRHCQIALRTKQAQCNHQLASVSFPFRPRARPLGQHQVNG